jgi:hypothetical protein
MLPQRSSSTDLLFLEPGDVLASDSEATSLGFQDEQAQDTKEESSLTALKAKAGGSAAAKSSSAHARSVSPNSSSSAASSDE